MRVLRQTLIALAALQLARALPLAGDTVDLAQNDPFPEWDDMILNEQQQRMFAGNGRNVITDETKRWPGAIVNYTITDEFTLAQKMRIWIAMARIEAVSCIRFHDTVEPLYGVVIKATATNCRSNVGYLNSPTQTVNLRPDAPGTGCMRVPIIQHELLHTIGFFHQHNQANRDDYITIVPENINPTNLVSFTATLPGVGTDFGFGYDYGSIMHYNAYAGSINGEKTIESPEPIGQRIALSLIDIAKLNVMYKCPGWEVLVPTTTTSTTSTSTTIITTESTTSATDDELS